MRKRVLISYIRVSTAQQGRSGLGIEAQRATITRFAEAEGYESAGIPTSSELLAEGEKRVGEVEARLGDRSRDERVRTLRSRAEALRARIEAARSNVEDQLRRRA